MPFVSCSQSLTLSCGLDLQSLIYSLCISVTSVCIRSHLVLTFHLIDKYTKTQRKAIICHKCASPNGAETQHSAVDV